MAKTLREHLEEKELKKLDEEFLTEEAATIAMGILVLPSVVAVAAYGASLMLTSYYGFLRRTTLKVKSLWQQLFTDVRNIFTKEKTEAAIQQMEQDSNVKKIQKEIKRNKKLYEDDLKEVYKAIKQKNENKAAEEFKKVDITIQNNPKARQAISDEIVKHIDVPNSNPRPNDAFKFMKKVLSLKEAKANEYAIKQGIRQNYEKIAGSEEAEDDMEGARQAVSDLESEVEGTDED